MSYGLKLFLCCRFIKKNLTVMYSPEFQYKWSNFIMHVRDSLSHSQNLTSPVKHFPTSPRCRPVVWSSLWSHMSGTSQAFLCSTPFVVCNGNLILSLLSSSGTLFLAAAVLEGTGDLWWQGQQGDPMFFFFFQWGLILDVVMASTHRAESISTGECWTGGPGLVIKRLREGFGVKGWSQH